MCSKLTIKTSERRHRHWHHSSVFIVNFEHISQIVLVFLLRTIVFRADTDNNRKIINFTYGCLYARPIKVVNVDNIIRNNYFYHSSKTFFFAF